MFGEHDEVLIPSILLCSLCDWGLWFTQLIHVCCSPFQYGCLDLPLSCQKIILGTPGFEDFGFLIHFAHLRNAEIVIWCYLFIYYSVETVKFLHKCISGFTKVIFNLLRGRSGENCHFCLRSTTCGPHFHPHDAHWLRHMTQRMS